MSNGFMLQLESQEIDQQTAFLVSKPQQLVFGLTNAYHDHEVFHWPRKVKNRSVCSPSHACCCCIVCCPRRKRQPSPFWNWLTPVDDPYDFFPAIKVSMELPDNVSFTLRYHTAKKVALFMHPHPEDYQKTLYWEGPLIELIDLKGHVILSETPIFRLIKAKLNDYELMDVHALWGKDKTECRDHHFALKMPLPEYHVSGTKRVLRVNTETQECVPWHCDLFDNSFKPYDFLATVAAMKRMKPLDFDNTDVDYSFSMYSRQSADNFRQFSVGINKKWQLSDDPV